MQAGEVLGARFELIQVAGQGAMGTVWRASDRATGALAAVKVLHGAGADLPRFRRESNVLAVLKHEAIVGWLGHGTMGDGVPWLAMEWLEGEALSDRLAKGPLTLTEVLTLGLRLLDGLEVAHAAGVVHRDLKPANVVLRGDDIAKATLVDFGIARAPDAETRLTRTGMILGTPAYMSPEQVRGVSELDGRTDLYALGAVLFECLTGRPPWVGAHVVAVLARILLEPAPRARSLSPGLPEWLDAALAALMAPTLSDRPSSAAAARALLSSATTTTLKPTTVQLGQAEQRLVSVVAAQLGRRDDGLADTLSPSEGQAIDGHAFALARLHGGRAEQLADGSLFAVFSGASAATDIAAQAARFALALRQELRGVRIGLATGRGRGETAVPVGEAVDLAVSALQSDVALGPGIPIDPLTQGLLGDRFEVSLDDGVVVLESEGGGPADSRLLLGKKSPFVGRARELSVLEGLVAQALDERLARVGVVLAGPGMGKSRLRRELTQRLEARGAELVVLAAQATQAHQGSPLALAGAIVRSASQGGLDAHLATIAPPEVRERLRVFLGELAGAPVDAQNAMVRAARADPMVMGDQLRRAFEDWLGLLVAKQPMVLLLDDVHWADAATLGWIDAALRRHRDAGWAVLAFARPEAKDRFPKLFAGHALEELRLAGLSPRAAEQLAKEALGDKASATLVARAVETAGGNAFYLEELLRAVAQGSTEWPATVMAMAQARLEALPPADRQLLRAAALVGEVFWVGAVQALTGHADAQRRLAALVELEVLMDRSTTRVAGEVELAFRHALLRDAAEAMLTDEDRVVGHRLAADWLSRHHAAEPQALARHFELGGLKEEAAAQWALAAQDALSANDLDASLAAAANGLALFPPPALTHRLWLLEAEANRWADRQHLSAQRIEALVPAAEPGSEVWLRAVAFAGFLLGQREQVARVVELGKVLLATPVRTEHAGTFLVAAGRVASQLFINQQPELATQLLALAERWQEAGAQQDPAAPAWMLEASYFQHVRMAQRPAEPMLEAARDVFLRAGDIRNAGSLRVSICFSLAFRARFPELAVEARALLDDAEKLRLTRLVTFGHLCLMLHAAWAGDTEALFTHAAACETSIQQSRDPRHLVLFHGALAFGCLNAGRPADAERHAREGLVLTTQMGHRVGDLRPLLAAALTAQGKPEEALTVLPAEPSRAFAVVGTVFGVLAVLASKAEALESLRRWVELEAVLVDLAAEVDRYAARFADQATATHWRQFDPTVKRLHALQSRAAQRATLR